MAEKIEIESSNILDELNKSFLSGKHDSFSKYTQEVQNFGHVPENQFDHAWSLIRSKKRDIQKERFNYLNDPMLYLGNIENEKTLALYQNDVKFLGILEAMALEDSSMLYVFEPLFEIFKIEIRLTGNIGNSERYLQAFHTPVASEKKGFKILGRKKKKKVEYVIPSEEEIQETMY
ncbi:MAG: hypothetical protein QHH15_00605 [Candidatus Thermoplasmatota archaeon]|nr:hypothetical protein [Candidatus Thermoplasmatota archaeon]